jgi:uncharacterized protein (TIGR02145 family)
MKNFIILLVIFLSFDCLELSAQVSISEDGSLPDSSAIFDVKSTSKGVLFPRLTVGQVDSISNPAIGLFLYCTTLKKFVSWNGNMWVGGDGDSVFHIGESFGGGKVFYIYPNGLDALIIADIDLTVDPLNWGCYGTFLGGTNLDFGSGQANTTSILAGCNEQGIPARGCDNLTYNFFSDWYLPSASELSQAVLNVDANWNSDFIYWSSTEFNANLAYAVGYTGSSFGRLKNQPARVRCIRLSDYTQCSPQPSIANAGPDQLNIPGRSTVLAANLPESGTGQWSIYSGQGGVFADSLDPSSSFTGVAGRNFMLRWTITTSCSVRYDAVRIVFACPDVNAGPDVLNIQGTGISLQGSDPLGNIGQWSILSGTGGNIADPSNPSSYFSGIEGNSYALKWEINGSCPNKRDTVNISFACPTANAGPDQVAVTGSSTTLQATAPFAGSGLWTIYSGSGGSITNASDPATTFTGNPGCTGYTLRWTVTSNCATVHDDVHIDFACTPMPTVANAGPDQSNIAGVTTTLQGNTPAIGTGVWNIVSGANGIISQPNNPASTFTGTNGTTYILSWTIYNSCCNTNDYVTISFAAFSCGNSFQDTRDGHVYTTLTRGAQCWMKQNLDYATGTSVCYAGNPTNCDNYGRLYDWNTASTACPTGWHLPTDAQWCTLLTGIDGTVSCGATGITGTDAGGKMKETGTTYWQAPNTGATNSSGFSARGGGTTTIPGHNLNQWVSFWTASTNGSNYWSWEMTYNDARVWHTYYGWSNTMSVRCLKN